MKKKYVDINEIKSHYKKDIEFYKEECEVYNLAIYLYAFLESNESKSKNNS